MDEVQSLGGPLICVERRLADQWQGIDGLSIEPVASMPEVRTDYDYACQASARYLSVLRLERGTTLILGAMPMITGVCKNSLSQVIIWRIVCAYEDDRIPNLIASLDEESFARPEESIEFSFSSPTIIIFDTSLPSDEADAESVSFEIAPGRYLVTTHLIKYASGTELVLHRFQPVV